MFQEMISKLFQRKQNATTTVTSDVAAPDLGNALLQPGIEAQSVIAQEIPEPEPVEIITLPDPIIEESEEQWSARIHVEWFAKEAGLK